MGLNASVPGSRFPSITSSSRASVSSILIPRLLIHLDTLAPALTLRQTMVLNSEYQNERS